MKISTIKEELNSLAYHGRGIIIGKSADGNKAITAYFIMGRSVNSRNRVFVAEGDDMRTKAFDESKLEDPSLIIYNPFLQRENIDIITNGDQTDTIYNALAAAKSFEDALGVSMLLVNTDKGQALFETMKGEKIVGSLETAKQPQLLHPTARPATRDEFWSIYRKKGIKPLMKKYGGVRRTSFKEYLYHLKNKLRGKP